MELFCHNKYHPLLPNYERQAFSALPVNKNKELENNRF